MRAERILSEDIPAPPDDVRAFYIDLDNIKTVHPLVVSVHRTGRTELVDGYCQSYRVKDRIPFGPLTLPTSYTAHLRVASVGPVITRHASSPRPPVRGGVLRTPRHRNQARRAPDDRRAATPPRDDAPRSGQGAHQDAGGHSPALRWLGVLRRTRLAGIRRGFGCVQHTDRDAVGQKAHLAGGVGVVLVRA